MGKRGGVSGISEPAVSLSPLQPATWWRVALQYPLRWLVSCGLDSCVELFPLSLPLSARLTTETHPGSDPCLNGWYLVAEYLPRLEKVISRFSLSQSVQVIISPAADQRSWCEVFILSSAMMSRIHAVHVCCMRLADFSDPCLLC